MSDRPITEKQKLVKDLTEALGHIAVNPLDDNVAYIKALAAADSHIERAEESLQVAHLTSSDGTVTLASIAHSLLAMAVMFRHAFIQEFREG